ncbi:MAG: hypothetical protein JWR07_1096 [Nevskia sp.]|jgi:hypothetical protein|nr:hypothetical protein [Nevskia sp.]
MAFVEWSMRGVEFANCNCQLGCPCQFNALPDKGHCRAHTFVQIEQGCFGEVPLDGLRWGIMAFWPGPIHLGDGTFMTIIEERADSAQRAAIEAISHGRETDPGSLIWQVFSTTVSKFLPTLYKPIRLSIDPGKATAQLQVPGLIDSSAGPILNPMTGAPHRVALTLPAGFEFTRAEFASGQSKTSGAVELNFDGTHSHIAPIHWSTHGVVR